MEGYFPVAGRRCFSHKGKVLRLQTLGQMLDFNLQHDVRAKCINSANRTAPRGARPASKRAHHRQTHLLIIARDELERGDDGLLRVNDANQVHHQLSKLSHVEAPTRSKLLDIAVNLVVGAFFPQAEQACLQFLSFDATRRVFIELGEKVFDFLEPSSETASAALNDSDIP